ncbi:MAG: hypothetical protein FRX49_11314 [Trebouxia sp. A1-2]|nr:MAG: hypothetical protein FRX49_11314 [Trebouxia sp. A1-2]
MESAPRGHVTQGIKAQEVLLTFHKAEAALQQGDAGFQVCCVCAQRAQLNEEGAWTCIALPAAGHAPDEERRTCSLRRPDCAAVGWAAAQQHAQIQQTSLVVERSCPLCAGALHLLNRCWGGAWVGPDCGAASQGWALIAWTQPSEHGLTGPRDWGLCSGTGPCAPAGLKRDTSVLAGQQLQRQMLFQLLVQHQSGAALWGAVEP